MPLQRAPVVIPLGGGLRTDIDPKLLPLGNVLELENARQILTGEIVKRYGGTALSNAVNSTTLASLAAVPVWQLASFRDDLIRLSKVGPTPISRWSPTMQRWTYSDWAEPSNTQPPIQSALRGPFTASTTPVGNFGTEGTAMPDTAVANGYVFTALLLSNAQVIIVATDQTTGETAWKYAITGSTNTRPRLAVANGYLVCAWINMTTHNVDALALTISTIPNTAPTVALTTAVGTTAHATFPWFDVIADGNNVAMAWRASTNKTLGAEFTPATGAHTNYEIKTSAAASIDPTDALAFVQNPVGYANLGIVTVNRTAVGVQVNAGFRGAGTSAQTHILDAAPTATISVTGVFTTASATAEVNVVYTVQGFDTPYNYLKFAEYTGGSTFAGVFLRSVFLQSKLFQYGSDFFVVAEYYAGTTTGLGASGTYFLLRVPKNMLSAAAPSGASGGPLAKIMPGGASGNGGNLSSVAVSGTTFVVALGRFNRLDIDVTTGGQRYNGINSVTITADPVLGVPVEAADSLYVPGALLAAFDGQSYTDDGFAVDPEPTGLASSATVGSMTSGGAYYYLNVFSYIDNNGRKAWSQPGIAVKVTVSAGQTSVDVTAKYLNLTQRALGFTGKLSVETYRTDNVNAAASASEFRLLRVDPNVTTADSFTFNDGVASVAGGELLYTTDGVLPNEVTPGFSALAVHQNRLFGISMDFGRADLWYTNEFVDGNVPQWNSSRVVKLEDAHGPGYGLLVLDDKLVVWKRAALYVVLGQGSDALGHGGTYQAQLVSSAIGSTNPQSLCHTDEGIFFQSTSSRGGLRFLTRGMSIDPAPGAPVQQYAETIVAACLVPAQSQARFYTSSGRTLVYDLVSKIWATYTGQPAVHAVCWMGATAAYARAGTNDVVAEDQTGATYLEAGAWFGMHAATPAIELAGLNGFERFYKIQGVGATAGTHGLRVRLYRNDEAAPLTDQAVTPGAAWDWETRYSTKLSRLRIVLDETQSPGVTQSAGPRMTALLMEIGVKQGLRKLPTANRTT